MRQKRILLVGIQVRDVANDKQRFLIMYIKEGDEIIYNEENVN